MSGQVMFTSGTCEQIKEYMATLPVGWHQYMEEFITMKLPLEVVKTFVETARRTRDSLWVEAQDEEIVEYLDSARSGGVGQRSEAVGKLHVTHLNAMLSEQQKAALRIEYAGVTDIIFAGDGEARRVDHPFMYSTRVVARAQLRRLISTSDVIVEVGAKVEHVVNMGPEVGKYHALIPVLDAHDMQRHSPADRMVQVMLRRSGRTKLKPNQEAVARLFLKDPTVMFHREKIQDITINADTVMSVDANYDIPLVDAVKFMHRGGIKRWLGCMVRCDGAGVFVGRAKGALAGGEFLYELDAAADTIEFHFKSSAFPYKHKLSVFRDYQVCNNKEFVVGGCRYVYRQLSLTTKTQLFFAIYAIPNRNYQRTERVYRPVVGEDTLRIHHPVAVLGQKDKFVMSQFEVPHEIFSRIVRDRLVAKNDDDGEVIRAIRAARVSVVVNGTRVSTDQTLAAEHVKALATVVKVYAAEVKKNGAELSAGVHQIITAGGVVRKSVGSTLWSTVCDAVAGPGSLVYAINNRLRTMRLQLADVGVKIEEVEKYVRMPDNVLEVLDEQRYADFSSCYCAERNHARELIDGKHGGLSNVEYDCIQRYLAILNKMRCVQCENDTPILDRLVEQYEKQKESAVGDKPESSNGDSGYVSGGDTEGSATDSDAFSDAVEFFEDIVDIEPQIPRAEGVVRQAMEEYCDVMQQQMLSLKSEAINWVKIISLAGWTDANLRGMTDGRLTHYGINVAQGILQKKLGDDDGVKVGDFKLVYDFNAGKWYEVRTFKGFAMVPRECGAVVYTNTHFLMWNQPILKKSMEALLAHHNIGPLRERVPFINGVYGCGKTRNIVSKWRDGDVYLTATARSAATVRRKLFGDDPKGRQFVRTYDSALMHGAPKAVGTLFLDEMPMAHFGQVLALMEVCMQGGTKVEAYGDFQQIRWMPFVAGYYAKYADGREHCDVTVMPVTHRCRASVVAATLRYYPDEYRIANCKCCEQVQQVEEAVYVEKVASLSQVPFVSGTKYIAFTQLEKLEIQTKMQESGIVAAEGDDATSLNVCSTVHEVQGETYDNVVVVRTNRNVKPGTIYFSDEHVVTALSRAKFSVRYFTLSLERDSMVVAGEDATKESLLSRVRSNAEFHGK